MGTEATDAFLVQLVANNFVNQYYGKLVTSPEEVYKFYEDSCALSSPNLDGVMSTTSTMQRINSKLLSLNYKFDKVELLNIHAQPSCNNGFIVLTTGFLIGEGDKKISFIQTFFLAKNAKGYFILNDIFEFATGLDESVAFEAVATENDFAISLTEEKQESVQVPVEEAEVKQPEVVPEKVQPAEIKQSEVVPEEKVQQQAEIKQSEVVPEKKVEQQAEIKQSEVVAEKVQQAEINQSKVVTEKVNGNGPMNPSSVVDQKGEKLIKQPNTSDQKQAQEQPPKMSYASMLAKKNPPVTRLTNRVVVVGPSANSSPDLADKKRPPPTQQAPPPRQARQAPPPRQAPHHLPRRNNASSNSDNQSEGKCIYIGNLPPSMTSEELGKAFEMYGKVKEDGVQVRTYVHDAWSYGFVEFESSDAARKAIDAHTHWFGTYHSYITEKKSPIQVSNGNGRSAPGKGNDNNRRSRENSVEGRRNGGGYQNGNFGQNRGSNNRNQKEQGSNESPGQNRGSDNGGKQKVVYQNGGAVKPAPAAAAK